MGGGIGGLLAVTALQRVGCEVDLVEVKTDWQQAGVGIIQPGNALRALDSLGLAQACLDAGFAYDGYDYVDAQGQLLHAGPSPKLAPHLPPNNGILRSRLHEILLAAARTSGASLRSGLTWTTLREVTGGVEVEFSNGSAARYDLVIGADGIYSPLRDKLFGHAYSPKATGQSVWRLTMQRPAHLRRGVMQSAQDRKAGYIPLSQDLMYLLLVTQEAPDRQMAREDLPAMLRERLQGFGGLVAQTMEQITDHCEVVYRPLEIVRLPQPWYRGHTILIGDAAHASTPHLGQGAAMAIEDGVVLAELVANGLTGEALGQAYMKRRFTRATEIQEASIQIGEFEQGRAPSLDLQALLTRIRACAMEAI